MKLALEVFVGLSKVQVEPPRPKEVANSEHHLVAVERLRQEVVCAKKQGAIARDVSGVPGEHNYGCEA